MTHADAFLRDILAHPDDDAPRLIFADWLEEQGDAGSAARAEFIRVQCALAAGNLPEQSRATLKKRHRRILKEYASEWARPIRQLVQTWIFHRGFIDEISMRSNSFLNYANRLFSYAPIQHLHLLADRGIVTGSHFIAEPIHMAVLADNEYVRYLRSLDLQALSLESTDVRALIVSEHLTNLTELNLSYNRIGDGGIRALATSSLLGRLKYLSLDGNDISAGGLRTLASALEELAQSPEGLRLQRLKLSPRYLSAAGQRVIADSPLLRRLVRL